MIENITFPETDEEIMQDEMKHFEPFCPYTDCERSDFRPEKRFLQRINNFTFQEIIIGHCYNCGRPQILVRNFTSSEWRNDSICKTPEAEKFINDYLKESE